jgi:4-alpha-glucanotransferase
VRSDGDGIDPWGVAAGWWGTDGAWHAVDGEVRAALARACGAAAHPDGPPQQHVWFVRDDERPALRSPATVAVEGGGTVEAVASLPELPLGAHVLSPHDGGPDTRLFVVPRRAPAVTRTWGLSVQLHGLRSDDDGAHGTLAGLAALSRAAAAQGAGVVAHNPLGAGLPCLPQEPSPYFASTRRFWSPLYLDLGALAVPTMDPDTLAALRDAGPRTAWVDRDGRWRRVRRALAAAWEHRRHHDDVRVALARSRSDAVLWAYGTFCAIAAHHGCGWTGWPAQLHRPDAPAVTSFARAHQDEVEHWVWVQLELDRQLAAAGRAGAALVADLPVGFAPDGFDAWFDHDLLAPGCRIGAPPDEFNQLGQDWGLPPFVPWRLRGEGYRSWLDTLRRVLRHAGGLRIDHVMGLFRLYWIPDGGDPGAGGYVHHHGTELLDLAVMEATRAGVPLIGEDLGTVEDRVRAAMAERGVLGYRVAWFDDDPAEHWPADTLGSLGTHDLPTAAGLWTGADERDRVAAGLPPDPEGAERMRARLARLVERGARVRGSAPPDGDRVEDCIDLAHEALAASGSDLVLASLEDVVAEPHRPNLPGTVDEHPNWRRPLARSVEQLAGGDLDRIGATMRRHRGEPDPSGG